ncbi:MAG TPA: hypothetical protein DCX65_13690, partial [Spirochaetaceae bacterium]|nr:hypothetical protein [Spirochaetaceae bacterium]
EVPSGGRVVLRDPTRDFNSQLLRLQVLLEETIVWSEANSGRFAQARELNFLDRAGNPVVVRLLLNPTNAAGGLSLAPSLEVGGQSLSLSLASRAGGLVELERTLGLVILRVSIDRRSNRYQITISLKRADIYPGMQDD